MGSFFGTAAVISGFGLSVVLAEGRIGEDAVEAAQLVVFVLVLRVGQVSALRISACEMPCSSMFILQMDQVVPIFSCLLSDSSAASSAFAQVVASLDQHAARANGRVVNTHAFLWVTNLDADAHDLGRV